MSKVVVQIKVSELKIHPLVAEIRSEKKIEMFAYTLKQGQENPVHVVERNSQYYVIDGIARTDAAPAAGRDTLECVVHDILDNQIIAKRVRLNQTSKTHIREKCYYFEFMLDIVGKAQGKKRDLIGFSKMDDDNHFGALGSDWFKIACYLTGFDYSASTARRLMHIYWAEIEDEKIKKLGLLDAINDNKLTINKGYGLLKDKKKKEEKKEVRLELEFQRKCTKGHYELFNKSAFNLEFIEDGSQDLCAFSPPYGKAMKEYRNQDNIRHGQEKTIEEYISNGMIACNEVKKKLGENGVMAVIIGESHKDGYSSVISRYELALIENGWEIIGVVLWIKENPTPVRLKEFFQPAEEKIIICKKKGAKVFFSSPVKESEGEGEFVLKQSHKSKDGDLRYYIGGDETITTNILTTPVFDNKEFGDIDPSFKHDAPCPFAVYDKILDAYSKPGMKYFEIFSGSGQGLVCAMKHGLEVIGVEIDPKSVEFTKKRLDHLIDEKKSITITSAA
ncbi:MAG: ParB N-terminal domain-containing protein [Chitinophagaceae bacterium]|nr:ParB N-terminal domain-containing protein [Chitinophagaceae bacterium]